MTNALYGFVALLSLTLLVHNSAADSVDSAAQTATPKEDSPSLIAPAKSIQSGLLLEPPLDLDWFTRDKFVKLMREVGPEKIEKKWKSPVVKLPEHKRKDVRGLTTDEVKAYMREAKRLFDNGNSIPVSDVGLISTQEDVIRRPMLNHICAFENSTVRVYLLVQRTSTDKSWGYYSIVQDLTVKPALDYFSNIKEKEVKFEGTSCYVCHSSGPLAIHPAREDLVLDAELAAALSEYIAEQPRSQFYFPKDSPKPKTGKPMALDSCTSCHDEDGDRGPLFQVQSHPIRVMVDFGYMPPDERLSKEEIAELKSWLDEKEE